MRVCVLWWRLGEVLLVMSSRIRECKAVGGLKGVDGMEGCWIGILLDALFVFPPLSVKMNYSKKNYQPQKVQSFIVMELLLLPRFLLWIMRLEMRTTM